MRMGDEGYGIVFQMGVGTKGGVLEMGGTLSFTSYDFFSIANFRFFILQDNSLFLTMAPCFNNAITK